MTNLLIKSFVLALILGKSTLAVAQSIKLPETVTTDSLQNLNIVHRFEVKASSGGNSGGGGNGFQISHPTTESLKMHYQHNKVILQIYLNRLQNKIFNMRDRDEATETIAKKMFSSNLLDYTYQDKLVDIKIDFQDADTCFNKDGEPKLASIHPKDPSKDICVSTMILSRDYTEREASIQMFAAILHEGYHLVRRTVEKNEPDTEEEEAIFLQKHFYSQYDDLTIGLRGLKSDLQNQIKIWNFPVFKKILEGIKISSGAFENLCQFVWPLVNFNSGVVDKNGGFNQYDALIENTLSLGLLPLAKAQAYHAQIFPLVKDITSRALGGHCDHGVFLVRSSSEKLAPIIQNYMKDIEFYSGLK